jgi:ABC-type branched-subunit amino acid transport system ATPase component
VGQYQELVVSLLVVGVVLFQPAGLVALWPRRKRRADATPQEPSPQFAFRVPQAPVDAIRIVGLGKHYGALRAVDRVDLAVPTGVIHGVIGPNGAGKTTLFNCISGFTSSDEGSLDILGQPVGSHPARTRIGLGVTRTFQHVAVFGSLTCLDNVLLGLGKNDVTAALLNGAAQLVARKGHAADVARAHAALAEVGLADAADKVAGQLSLGNQRRLEIARAIVSQPRVLLLDEPVSGVSRAEESQIADLLRGLNRDHGITMVLIEHNMAFVRGLCHTLSVMSAGRIIAEGEPGIVLDSPLVQRIYFGAAEAKNAA